MTSVIPFKVRNVARDAIMKLRDVGVVVSEPVVTVAAAGVIPVTTQNISLAVLGAYTLPQYIYNLKNGQVLTLYIRTTAGVTTLASIAPNTVSTITLVASTVNTVKVFGGDAGYTAILC